MLLQSFFGKNTLLLFLASVLFGLVAISTPVTDDTTNRFFGNGKCKLCSASCRNPLIRKEWSTLSKSEKKNYLNAVNCLAQKPSLPALHSKYPGTITRTDDFTAVHTNQSDYIHFTAYFFHWHRYFVAVYEKALREECHYKGAQPYWNTSKDLASGQNINSWDIFSNDSGFGGNGVYVSHAGTPNPYNLTATTGGGCVPAGPFGVGSTFKVNLIPGRDLSTTDPTCLKRDFWVPGFNFATQSLVDATLIQPTFFDFHKSVQTLIGVNLASIHGGPHVGIGGFFGAMSDFFKSPSDPLFYMHHTNLDRIFTEWQLENPNKRLCEVGGPTVPYDYNITQGPPLTLGFEINIDVMGPNIAVGDLLSTVGGPLCYKYAGIP